MDSTRTELVLHPAQNVLQGPTLIQEPPDALRVPEDSTQVMRRDNATTALQEAMRQVQGQQHALHAQAKPVLRRELLGATNVGPELALMDLVPKWSANLVLEGIILPPTMPNPAQFVPTAKLLE